MPNVLSFTLSNSVWKLSGGNENSGYANFKVADGIEGFALFVSDWMAPSVDNADKKLPVGFREKSLVPFSVDNVDDSYAVLKAKGVIFVNKPADMADWGNASSLSTRSRRQLDRVIYSASTRTM